MTHEELLMLSARKLAEEYLKMSDRLAEVEAQRDTERGEIVKACPYCGNQESISDFAGQWMCEPCNREFDEPAYWQRVKGPQE